MIDGGVASTLSAMNDSVTFINSVIDGTNTKDWTIEEFKVVVRSNKIFLEQYEAELNEFNIQPWNEVIAKQ